MSFFLFLRLFWYYVSCDCCILKIIAYTVVDKKNGVHVKCAPNKVKQSKKIFKL